MTTLITGSGLVGTSFAQFAAQRDARLVFYDLQPRRDFIEKKVPGADVELVQGDILDLPGLLHAMTKHRVDTVVHTAGLVGTKVADAPYTGVQINVMGTINVLEAVRLAGVRRLVHISSLSIYDQRRECPAPLHEDFPRGNGRLYDNTKVAKELMVEAYQRLYGFEVIVLRLAKLYGFGHFQGGSAGGRLIQTLVHCGLRGEVARVPRPLTTDFEYVYAKDVGRAVDIAATIPLPAQPYFNIGSGEVLTFEDLVEAVRGVLPSLAVEILPGPPPATQVKQPLDLSRAREVLGWEPQYAMENAFRDYVADLEEVAST
ncbi:MAG: NAD(P)-dependent oxidoreductase [Deltaproteobacteria bacterium]|nr:NAD(P)-dependent oxidoreductase [Deltaproteobacteria bacterium]